MRTEDAKDCDYYLGLDIGTSSLGWAVTDKDYNILQHSRKALWGVHLFDEGKTASERRTHRCARRRYNRRKQRIALLREIFNDEICKVDQGFFERLDESGLKIEDRNQTQPNSLFNDSNFSDRSFHSKFPTIYHLRNYLMTTDEKPDIRLVYLAIHHIVKYRGHFLFSGLSSEGIPSFDDVMNVLLDDIEKYGMDLQIPDVTEVSSILSDRSVGINDKKRALSAAMGCDTKQEKEFANLLSGGKTKLNELFDDESLKGQSVSFKDPGIDDRLAELEDSLDADTFNTLRIAKRAYEWSVLTSMLKGFNNISQAKINLYDKHAADLKTLKKAVRTYIPDCYRDMFKLGDKKHIGNYCSYSGVCGKKKPEKTCDSDTFCKYCLSMFKNTGIFDDPQYSDMISRLKNNEFMPKQSSKENSVLPYTVHQSELRAILSNVSRFYPFLNTVCDDGFTPTEKIVKIQEFRIPYYIGPLDSRSSRAWVVRKSNQRTTPWNFENVIDMEASAESFMDNLTSTCTYMVGEKVLPKNSPTYLYFQIYNELNNIRVNGDRLPLRIKKRIVAELFEDPSRRTKVTVNVLKKYLQQIGEVSKKDPLEITGIDNEIKSTLRPLLQIRAAIGDKANDRRMCDEIVRIVTVFDDSRQVKSRLTKTLGNRLSKDEISSLSKLRFEGWGRLSERFLTGIRAVCPDLGREACILDILENTSYNLMEVYHKFGFQKIVDDYNISMTSDDEVTYKSVDELYVSPAVKRGIWRTVCVVRDVVDHIGHPPSKVFVETTRQATDPADRRRTESRKDNLVQLYKACKADVDLMTSLEGRTEADLKSRSLYLYYTQLGRCMYCGKPIDVENLGNKDLVDRDHIYPQSVTKDDSIHNNMALACRECNSRKSNTYPIPAEWQRNMRPFWDELLNKKLIRQEKYSRLVRTEPFTEDELAKFINRQLVETSQSVKGAISILKRLFGEETDIVYVKAGEVSRFRQFCDSPITTKCRMINDLHHAKDAYLNIVVGNVYDTKFTKDVNRFLGTHEQYNLAKMYDKPVSRNGTTAWIPGDNGTKATVLRYMRRDNILFTRYPVIQKGMLFDDNLIRAKDTLFDRKKNRMAEKYGGYDNVKGACYSIIRYNGPKGSVTSIESIPVMEIERLKDATGIRDYFSEDFGEDVEILIPIIRVGSLFDWDGFRMTISGRTGNSIVFYPAIQMLVPDDKMLYIKKLSNYSEDRKDKTIRTAGYYGISREANTILLEYLLEKSRSLPYSKVLKNLSSNIEINRIAFDNADELSQANVLVEILHSFHCDATTTSFESIGGVKTTGRIVLNKKIPRCDDVWFINQSPSGLSENRIKIG